MKKAICLLLLVFFVNNKVNAQLNDHFGIGIICFQAPDIAFQLRMNYYLDNFMLNTGIDLNGNNTFGKIIGLHYFLGKYNESTMRKKSLQIGFDYDFTNSALYGYDTDDISGTFLIPKNQYIIPMVGYCILDENFFIESIWNDLSITFSASYKIPLLNPEPIFKSGTFSEKEFNFSKRYLNGGLNFGFKLTFII